jgi:ferredoxin-NADP reductase
MAGTAVLGRLSAPLTWQVAQVAETRQETRRVRTIALQLENWSGHRAGQHVDVRLTAEDGYQAQRSYSIASGPEDGVELTVERLDDGEVSPYLVDELRARDGLELRGPIGGYFVWEAHDARPVLLVAGGSGVVPMRAMIRHRIATGSRVPMRLLYSSRTIDDVIYRAELDDIGARGDGIEIVHTLTRAQPEGWTGYARRIDPDLIRDVAWPASDKPSVFVCGATSFVEAIAEGLVGLGYDPLTIKTERYGGTGG